MAGVTIAPLRTGEFETVAHWLSDRDANRWLTSEWRGRDVSSRVVAIAVRNRRNRLFATRCDGALCGLVGLSDIDSDDRTAMVWYVLGDTRVGGKGVMTQAVREAVALAFRELELRSVYAWIMEDNLRSRRVLEKCGFREAGRIRNAANSGGIQVDRIYFDRIDE